MTKATSRSRKLGSRAEDAPRGRRSRRRETEERDDPAEGHRLAEIADDVFDALIQVRRLEEGELPAPEVLHQKLSRLLESVPDRASDAGLAREDGEDIQYALVAFADEVAIHAPHFVRDYWQEHLLQMELFEENLAGDGFFERLEDVRKRRGRPEVLLAYYLCLALGFQGKYRVRGGEELPELIESVRESLNHYGLKEPDVMSPSADRTDEGPKVERRRAWILLIPATVAVLSLLAYVAFGRIQPAIDQAVETVNAVVRG